MFRLTREVRFAINSTPHPADDAKTSNGFGGVPALRGLGYFFTLRVTLGGELQPQSSYLRNIKEVDQVVRQRAVPVIRRAIHDHTYGGGAAVVLHLFDALQNAWPGATVQGVVLSLSPFQSTSVLASEFDMGIVRLSQKFEFSAAHRLHNPALSASQNVETFGKCNNPAGHGHNYELQVTLKSVPDAQGVVYDVPTFERLVEEFVIQKLDHKHLNQQVPEFADVNPSVENIARVIHTWLKPVFTDKLAGVTVWETPKTWCEYGE